MAIETKFTCSRNAYDFLTVNSTDELVLIEGVFDGVGIDFYLDIPTAIKLSKTIRTHINLVKGV